MLPDSLQVAEFGFSLLVGREVPTRHGDFQQVFFNQLEQPMGDRWRHGGLAVILDEL